MLVWFSKKCEQFNQPLNAKETKSGMFLVAGLKHLR